MMDLPWTEKAKYEIEVVAVRQKDKQVMSKLLLWALYMEMDREVDLI